VDEHPDSEPDHPVSRLRIRAIPGAKRSGLVGPVGDRLKVKVNAPPENGKANQAICRLIAKELGLRPTSVRVESGATDREKTLRLEGIDWMKAAARLGLEADA
jgi:uncharacterized protein